MDTKNLFILIIGLLNIFLGLVVYLKHHKQPVSFWFFVMCLFGGGWGVVKAFQLSVMDIFWQDHVFVILVYIFGILAAFAYVMLCYHFPYKDKIYSKPLTFFIYFVPLVLIVLGLLGIIKIHENSIIDNILYREIRFTDFLVFGIYFFVYVFLGAGLLYKKYLSADGVHRIQIKYLLIGTLGTFLTTGYVSIFLLLLNNFKYDWLGAIFLFINFSITGYLIFIRPLNISIK
ncbi:MAG: hypothetical protein NTV81_01990 [Candidatus Komeilibacteria bacterium]|nr:hypothetical protein [Candidatus Komeilibacteria bacterium]